MAPDGWQLHDFWNNLSLLVTTEGASLGWASLFLVLLVAGRALLPRADRSRLNLGLGAFAIYFITVPVRAVILSYGKLGAYRVVDLVAAVAEAWGIIGVGGL